MEEHGEALNALVLRNGLGVRVQVRRGKPLSHHDLAHARHAVLAKHGLRSRGRLSATREHTDARTRLSATHARLLEYG